MFAVRSPTMALALFATACVAGVKVARSSSAATAHRIEAVEVRLPPELTGELRDQIVSLLRDRGALTLPADVPVEALQITAVIDTWDYHEEEEPLRSSDGLPPHGDRIRRCYATMGITFQVLDAHDRREVLRRELLGTSSALDRAYQQSFGECLSPHVLLRRAAARATERFLAELPPP
jgi:hypothetical protein